ncbi:EpsG family protein [Comamonas testosteroni]|uniref:EpsG family protein n=1 Tax=Comamonas testosteroni TaxID=285 RepID=UPI002DB681BE|nr:EpsG family protein [Comamonas testosteroni]MEB5963434.1 EpsG family protein [Comamonas testosteroni]
MIPYYLLFCFFGVLAFLEYFQSNKRLDAIFLILSFIVLLFFYGFRFDVGIDWSVYYSFYDQVESIARVLQGEVRAPVFFSLEFAPLDFGYRFLNSVFKSLGVSFQGLIFFISLFNIFSLYNFILSNRLKYKFSFLLVFISLAMFREFDILRQSLSFYIFLYSVKYIDGRLWKYFAINMVGAFFHIGALMLLLIVPILKMRFSRGQMWIILFLYILTMVFPLPLISLSLAFAEMLSLPSWLLVKVVAMHEYLNYPREFGLTISIPCILLLSMIVLKYRVYENLSRRDAVLINLFFCYLLISILGSEINEFVTRFGYYFFVGIALAFSFIPIFVERLSRLLLSVIPVVFAVAKLFLMMETPATSATYTPYTNYLFEDEKDRFLKIDEKKSIITDYYLEK